MSFLRNDLPLQRAAGKRLDVGGVMGHGSAMSGHFFFNETRYSTRFTRSASLITVCKLGVMRETFIFSLLARLALSTFSTIPPGTLSASSFSVSLETMPM